MKALLPIALATALGLTTVYAQPGGGPGKGPRGGGGDGFRADVIEKLELTAEQKSALDESKNAMQLHMVDLRAAAQKAKLTTRNLMDADTIDRDALMASVEAESAAELAINKARIEHMLLIREIIGPEKASELRELMQERRGDRRGKGQRRGGWDDESDDDSVERGQRRRR